MSPPRKRAAVAVLLGVLVPGLGQAYAGYPRRAVFWFLGAAALGTLTINAMLTARRPPFNLVVPMLLLFVYYIVEIVDAARVAHRSRPLVRAAYDRWWVWAGIVAVFMLVVQPAVTAVLKRAGQGVLLHEDSMSPALLKYDFVMIHKAITTRERGEVVGVAGRGTRPPFVARVIGLPGDRVGVSGGQALVNGVPLKEPYVYPAAGPPTEVEMLTVPAHTLFLLGDKRSDAEGGGRGGLVAEQDVLGRANVIYFSQDPATRAIRWARIGQPVR